MAASLYRNTSGKLLTSGLFLEMNLKPGVGDAIYSLKREDVIKDGRTFPSFYRIYLNLCTQDPTEYLLANECFESYIHWEQITETKWMTEYLREWRREVQLAIRSKALANLLALSQKTESKSHFNVNKYLLEGNWRATDGDTRRGRPSKESVQKAAYESLKQSGEMNTVLDDDYKRLIEQTQGNA